MGKVVITISTAKAPLTIAQLGVIIESPGLKEIEIEKGTADKFKETYEKSKYFKRMSESGKLKIIFKELTQEEVDTEFEELKKIVEEKGKHNDLLGLDHEELKEIYEKEIGNAPGNRKTTTMINEIIEKREEAK